MTAASCRPIGVARGSGDMESAEVNVSDNLNIEINGAGNVYYKGSPNVTQEISGLGRIKSLY